MRILELSGWDDFSVLSFQDAHSNVTAKEVMDNLDKFQPEEEGEWVLKVHEVEGELSAEVSEFIKRNFIDYDDKKHKCFYVESEIIN